MTARPAGDIGVGVTEKRLDDAAVMTAENIRE
jgi:hypothetical protein